MMGARSLIFPCAAAGVPDLVDFDTRFGLPPADIQVAPPDDRRSPTIARPVPAPTVRFLFGATRLLTVALE